MSLSTQNQHYHSLYRLALAMAALLVCLTLAPYGHAQEPAPTPEEQCLTGAQLFFDKNDHAGALPFLEAGFTGRTARPFQNLSYLAYCSLALGTIRNNNRDFAGALEAYTVAQETFRQGPERQWDGNIQYGLGQANYYLGRFAEAEAAYLKGLAIARERKEEAALLPIAKDLISLYGDQGRYEEAIAIYTQLTLQQREQIGLDASSLNILGTNYRALGRYTEARTAHEEALKLDRDQGDRLGEASSLKLLAQVYQSQGQFAEARTRLNQALELYADEPGGRASTFSDLGLLEYEAGRLGAALTYFEQALASIPPDDTVPVRDLRATIISNRAMTFVAQGQYAAARLSLDAAQKLYEANGNQERIAITSINLGALAEREANQSVRSEDRDRLNERALAEYQAALTIIDTQSLRPLRALTLNNIGALLSKLERSAEATPALTEGLAIARELKNPRDTAIALVNLADIDQLQGRYAEALVRYDEALALAREAGSQGVQVEALARSARTLQLQGNASAALPRYEQALGILAQMPAAAGGDEGRAGFSANYADIYERATRLYLAQGNPAGAFATVERGRARAFLDSLAAGDIQLADQARNERAERFRTAQAALEALHAELALVRRSDPPDQNLIARLETALAQAEDEHQQALTALQRDGAQAALFLADGPAVGELAALQR